MKKQNLILCLGLAIPLTGTTVLAVENDPTTEMSSSKMNEIIEKNSDMFIYDEIIGHKSLSLNSTEIPLYVTFENQLTALSNFKEKFSNELETIKLEMELEDLNEQNYDNYCDATYVLLENEKLDQDKAQEILAFFDIFENTGKFNTACFQLIEKQLLMENKIRFNEKAGFGEDLLFSIHTMI